MKILIAPTEIAGQYRALTLALGREGHPARFVSYRPSPFAYGNPNDFPTLVRLGRVFHNHAYVSSFLTPRILMLGLAHLFFSLWGLGAVFRYDAYIFGFGQSLLPLNLDIPLIRLRKKPIIVNLSHGSEIRQPYADGTYRSQSEDRRRFIQKLCRLARRNQRRARFLERWASVVIGSPLASSVFLNDPFVNVFSVGKPVEVGNELGAEEKQLGAFRGDKVRILHAPSNRVAKGSDVIERIVGELQSEGYPIEYLSVSGVSNAEILRAISVTDIVIDQIYSDIPTPTLTLESCLMGKAVIVGGLHLEHFSDYFDGDLVKAIRFCTPEELRVNIIDLVSSAEMREEMGARGKAFADEFCDPSRVAKNYLRLIHGDFPESWFFAPQSVDYPWGVGQSKRETLENVKDLISLSGRSVLGLDSRPRIWAAYCEAAEVLDVRLEN